MDRIKNCDNLIVNKDTIGSGLAIRLDGHDDYIDASTNGYKPNDNSENYTIEIWVKPEQLDRTQYIFSLAHGLGDAGNSLILKNTNRFNWTVKNNAGTQIVTIDGSTVKVDKFYHITLVKNNTIYKLYINGVLKGAQQGFVSGDCTRNRFIFGARLNSDTTSDHFRGKLDEVRIWNTPLTNLNVLRNWMCRKLTPQHPSYTNLVNYFRFDIVDLGGVVKERKQGHDAQLKNVGFSHYSNYQNSGAPIGDDSKQIYPPDWNTIALSYTHSNGDMMTVTRMGGGDPEGVHVYMVNQKPNDTRLPNDAYFNMGDYYYGIFMAGGNDPEYELIYDYEGNPKAGDATNHRLLKRNDNSDAWDGISGGWRNAPAKLTTTTNTLSTRPGSETYRSEYIFVNRETRITNVSGPGNAIKFDGADTTYAQIIPFSKPSGAYTVSSWCKLDHYHEGGWLFHFPGGASSPVIPGGQRYVGVKVHSNDITLKIGGISANAENNALFDANTGWNHVALVMENKKATVYVNGIPVPDLVDINIGEQDVNATKVYVGHQFKGTIDEFRVWNMALDSITIRKWLCRKISEDHPYKNEYLTGYYQCDEGEGTLIENARGGSDMELVGNVQWVRSGAPLGDTSVYMYGATTLGMDHPDRGRLSIQLSTEGGWEDHLGAHLYRVDNAPQNTHYPVAGTRTAAGVRP